MELAYFCVLTALGSVEFAVALVTHSDGHVVAEVGEGNAVLGAVEIGRASCRERV